MQIRSDRFWARAALFAALLGAGCTNGPTSVTGGLNEGGSGADSPALAMNMLGDAFVAWEQDGDAGINAAANDYDRDAGWGGVEFLSSGGGARDVDVAMNHYTGDAVAAWAEERANGSWGVFARRYDGDTRQWGPAETVALFSDPDGPVLSTKAALDADGNVTLVWTGKWSVPGEPSHYGIFTSDSAPGGAWSAPLQLDRAEEDGRSAWSPAIAMNEDGNAVVTFIYITVSPGTPPPGHELAEIHAALYVNPFDGGPRVWSAPMRIGEEAGHVAWGTNRIAIDGNGDAFAVWQEDAAPSRVLVNRYLSAGGWQGPDRIRVGTGAATSPDIATNYWGGRWALVWAEEDVAPAMSIYGLIFENGSWGAPALLDDSDAPARTPRVAMGMEIGILTTWIQDDAGGTGSVFSSTYEPGAGWRDPELAENDDGEARSPVLVMNLVGFAIAAWVREDGTTTDIWANTYDPQDGGWGLAGRR